jgi:hypothetical protein
MTVMELTPQNLPPNAIIISISQADSFLTCERKWMFSYVFEKQSDHMSRSLAIGVIGHDIAAVYYQALKDGLSKFDALQAAMKKLSEYFSDGKTDPEVLGMVHGLVSRYIEQVDHLGNLEILEVEEDFFIPVNDDFWYGMRIDLLVKDSRGQVRLIDHKFTYDFNSSDDLELNSQMPKYVAGLRFSGYPVVEAYLNQFRTRFKAHLLDGKANSDLYQLSPVGITQEKLQNSLEHQLIASERIVNRRALPLELIAKESLPIQNRMICKNCPFKGPCVRMENGVKNPLVALGTGYVQKESGFTITKNELVAD